eukprot:c28152_g1_i1 orf=571-2082(+)
MPGRGKLDLSAASELVMRGGLSILKLTSSSRVGAVYTWVVIVAGFFVLVALAVSTFLIFEHLSWYNNPEEQKWLIGVILIVPLYATESFLSLCSSHFALEWEILRDCYEAFALYSFGRYLIACLGGEDRTIEMMERQAIAGPRTPLLDHSSGKAVVKHLFPLNYFLKPWSLGQEFYQAFKFGIVQYMILKTVCALLSLVLQPFDAYGEGNFKWDKGYPYIAVVMNFSQSWALYCLIQFYNNTQEELAPIKPLAKFLCFKSIVFLTWWQGVIIAIIFSVKAFFPETVKSSLRSSVQDFLICIEMGFAAMCYVYVFPAKPYHVMGQHKRGSVSVLADYASIGSPLDPEEIKQSEQDSFTQYDNSDIPEIGTSLKESMHDVVFKGGEYIVNDLKFTVEKVREPVEKGISRLNEAIHQLQKNLKHHEKDRKRHSKDDSWLSSNTKSYRSIRGIDDPLLTGSVSDSGVVRSRKRKSSLAYGSAESSSESSDQGFGSIRTSGHRWTVKD